MFRKYGTLNPNVGILSLLMRSVNVSSLNCNLIYEKRTTDYDGPKVSTEHTIEHLDDPTLFGEDYETSGHGDECWEYCHPDNRFGTCLYSSFLMSYLREAVKNSFFRNDS